MSTVKKLSSASKQSGHAVLFVVLGLAVAASSFFAWQHVQSNKDAASSDQAKTQTQKEDSTGPSEEEKYLDIKEWGIRFILPKELQGDLNSYVSNTSSSGSILFESKKLNSMTSDKTCALVEAPEWGEGVYTGGIQASLVRINPTTYPKDSLDYYKSQLHFVKNVGDYEYYYRKQLKNPPVSCLTGIHEEYSPTEQAITNELQTAFGSIEPTPNGR